MTFPGDNLPLPEGEQEDVLAKIERFRGMSEVFVEDLLQFAQFHNMHSEAERRNLTTEIPENYGLLHKVPGDLFNVEYVAPRVLQNLGAPLVVVDIEGNGDYTEFPGRDVNRAIYTPSPRAPKRIVRNILNRFDLIDPRFNDEYPGYNLLRTQTTPDPIPPIATDAFGDVLPQYKYVAGRATLEDGMVERHFMLSSLRSGLMHLRLNEPEVPEDELTAKYEAEDRQSLEMYEKLRQEGYRALGPEEVYGIMSSAILRHLELNPEEDFRKHSKD